MLDLEFSSGDNISFSPAPQLAGNYYYLRQKASNVCLQSEMADQLR